MASSRFPFAKNALLLKFTPTWSLSGEVVTTASGKPVEIHVVAQNTLRDVLNNIAAQIDICRCQLRFVSEFGELQLWSNVQTWLEDMQAGKLRLYRIRISRTDKDLLSYYTDFVCLRCLREAGFQAKDFIDHENIRLTALEFRWAGYTIADLVHCFPEHFHPLRSNPPATSFTLFDCQLKDAGYDAKDFRDAGYLASQLSEGMSLGDLEWAEVGAYFTASEMVYAGYSASELYAARFPESEILNADCRSDEFQNARALKQRRLV